MKDAVIGAVLPVVPSWERGRISGPAGGGGRVFKEMLAERMGGAALPAGEGAATASVRRMVEQLDAGNRALDEIIESARRGRRFSPQELLVLQAQIYRFGEQAALATKVAEQAASELKRLWQMQV